MTGDFFQLPPVVKGGKVSFAFEADMWNHAIKGNMFKLTKVFRQRDQGLPAFMRLGTKLTDLSQSSLTCSTRCDMESCLDVRSSGSGA